MRPTSAPGSTDGDDRPDAGAHTLLVADTDQHRRHGVARWVGRELALGSKVFYRGWLGSGLTVDQHWLAGPGGPRGGRDAVASGQLEFLDFPTLIERTAGTADAVLALQTDEIERALDAGWSTVAVAYESPHRPMGEGEAAELVAVESGFDAMTDRWPLTVLCQLSVPEEKDAAIWETVGVHHRDLVDGRWSAEGSPGWWRPRGEVDAHVALRFGAAARAALLAAEEQNENLHLDLSEVGFLDVACARMLLLAAGSMPDGQHLVVHEASTVVQRLLDALGRPRTVLLDRELSR